MEIVSKQAWLERFGKASLDDLRKGALEYGHTLRARTRADAADECYELYAGKMKASTQDPPAPDAKLLAYEARCTGHGVQRRCRAGYSLTRFWARLGNVPSAEQLAELAADPFVQVRIAE